jgi:hypothetical protein
MRFTDGGRTRRGDRDRFTSATWGDEPALPGADRPLPYGWTQCPRCGAATLIDASTRRVCICGARLPKP